MMYSYSDILTFQRCPKQFEFKVIQNIERRIQASKLTLGILVHELLMAHYLGRFEERAAELLDEINNGQWRTDDELGIHHLYREAIAYVESYIAYHDDEWEILHCEETFTATVDGVAISFTPDLVIRDRQGVWIVDHKTTVALPQADLPVGNFQAFLYSSIIREIYPDFKGFIFNFIRKKTPREPRLTKTGDRRVADIGRIDTTYEVLRDFLFDEAPDLLEDPTHKRRLAELKDRNRFFWRQHVYITDEMADEILSDIAVTVDMIDVCVAAGRFPRSFLPYAGAQACESCDFAPLCVADLRGYNVEELLPLYQERDMTHRKYDYTEEVLIG